MAGGAEYVGEDDPTGGRLELCTAVEGAGAGVACGAGEGAGAAAGGGAAWDGACVVG